MPVAQPAVSIAALSAAAPHALLASLLAAPLPVQASLSAQDTAAAPTYQRVQLLPAGQFAGRDGRPAPGASWALSDTAGQALAAKLNARHVQSRFRFDYEHQSLNTKANGQPAPASGWAHHFEWVSSQGLFATDVTWTDSALAMLRAGEYAYISPVLVYEDGGHYQVLDVYNAALVHTPSLMQLSAVTAALNAFFVTDPPSRTPSMDLLQQLIAKLGLPAGTTAEAALGAVLTLQTNAAASAGAQQLSAELGAALGLGASASIDSIKTAVAALKAAPAAGSADSSLAVIAHMQAQIAALSAQQTASQAEQVVSDALSAGKLLPVQRTWALELGKKDMAALSAFVAAAPVIAPTASAHGGAAAADTASADGLTAGQRVIAAQLGMDLKKYAEHIKAQTSV